MDFALPATRWRQRDWSGHSDRRGQVAHWSPFSISQTWATHDVRPLHHALDQFLQELVQRLLVRNLHQQLCGEIGIEPTFHWLIA